MKPVKPKYLIEVFLGMGTGPQRWRWHLLSLTGKRKIVCTSGEPFDTRGNALRAARRMRTLLVVPTDFLIEKIV